MGRYKTLRACALYCVTLIMLVASAVQVRAASGECSSATLNGSGLWHPISMRENGDGRLKGVFPELAEQIFGTLEVPLNIGPSLPWKRLQTLLENGEIDVLAGAYLTKERRQKFGVSLPVMKEDVAVFIRSSLPSRPEKLEDLVGLQGVAPFGASYGEQFDTFAASSLAIDRQPFDDLDTLMWLLVEDKADYLVIARQEGERMLENISDDGLVEMLPWPAAVNTLHFMFSKQSACISLLEAFDAELKRVLATGKVDDLIEDYGAAAGR
ncbi:MAG: transporter substrate-binding domain-containing protein [Roseibium sp.]